MKVNYLSKNKLSFPYFKRILILVTVFISGAIIVSFLNVSIISIFTPIWRAENVIGRSLRNSTLYFSSQKALIDENTRLEEKISSLETELLSVSRERSQEDVLLELVGRKREANVVLAGVLTHPPQTPYDVIVIDVGSNDSVSVGFEVSMTEGPILGVISEVFAGAAKVKLFTRSGEKTNAILERNNVPVTLVGSGGGNFNLSLPRDVAVERGDRILSAGIASQLLAVVEDISVRPTDSFREVLARSPANIFAIRYVFVTP